MHRPLNRATPITVRGFPCTDATRTLVDVAAAVSPTTMMELVDRALALQLTAVPRLERALLTSDRYRTKAAALRRHLAERGLRGSPAPSVLESRATRLFRQSGLPDPVVQHQVAPGGQTYRLDFVYPNVRLAIEVKGYRWHSSAEQLTADDRRQNALVGAGWTVLSFDWWAVTHTPNEVAHVIAETYGRLLAACS